MIETSTKGFDWGGFIQTDSLDSDPPIITSVFGRQLLVVDDASGALALIGAEAALGNPPVDGYVLSSTALGVRSWIDGSSGADDALTERQTEYYSYLAALTDRTVALAKASYTAGAFSGQTYISPGNTYQIYEFVRDLAMLVRNRPQVITATNLLAAIARFYAVRGSSGQIFDAINGADSNAILAGGSEASSGSLASVDNQFEWVDLIYSHFLKTGLPSAYLTYKAGITAAMAYPTIVNHLVSIAHNATPANVQVGFGYQDVVLSEGYELMTSVERYRALRQLAAMATAAGETSNATAYTAEAALIPGALQTYLWDATAGLFRNASSLNTQHSIPGSAYAVVQGCVSSTLKQTIIAKLIAGRPGNADDLAGKGFYQGGAIRHLPLNENWTSVNRFGGPGPDVGIYQNGAYWPPFTGWVATAIAMVDPDEAEKLMGELVTSFQGETPLEVPFEVFNTALYSGSPHYVDSAANPLELYAGHALLGVQPNPLDAGGAQFVLQEDTNPNAPTVWNPYMTTVFGPLGSAGPGLGISYSTTNNTAYIDAVEPNVAWRRLRMNVNDLEVWTNPGGGQVRAFHASNGRAIVDNTLLIGTTSSTIPTSVLVWSRGTGSSSSVWKGRIASGGDNVSVVSGEYNSQAWIAGHTIAPGVDDAWADLYIQPGPAGLGTGTYVHLGAAGGSGIKLDGPTILTPQALSGVGAVNVTTSSTAFTSTGSAQALTLADGTAGQIKTICHVVDGGSGVLTPTTKSGYSTITFTNAGDSVTLQFHTTAGWCIIGSYGVTIAP